MTRARQRRRTAPPVSGVNLTWQALNALLRRVRDPDAALVLLEEERRQPVPRTGRLIRLHARYNRLRAVREKSKLL